MDWVDWLILGVVAASTLFGIFRGLIHEVISLVSWVAAFVVAKLLLNKVYQLITPWIEHDTLRWLLAWLIPFVIVILLGAVARFVLSEFVNTVGLGGVNNLMGGGFGFLRGVLIITVMVLVLRLTIFTDPQPIRPKSILLPYFDKFVGILIDPVSNFFNSKMEQLKEQIRQLDNQGKAPDPMQLMNSLGWDKKTIEYLKNNPELVDDILEELKDNPNWQRRWEEDLKDEKS